MESPIAIMSSTGNVILPEEVQASLGLHGGSRLAITLDHGRIVLQPVPLDELEELCGIFSSTPGLAEELQEERRQDKW